MNKQELRSMFSEFKKETLEKNKNIIDKYRNDYNRNLEIDCDLINDEISVEICETKEQKQKWTAYVHLTTSLPYRGAVGRQVKLFVKCGNHILGMVHLVSPLAQMKVSSTFSKYSNIPASRHITGADAARKILDKNGLSNIVIERVRGNLTDHYDPTSRVLRLSDSVYSSTSIAAIGVAAHECGHAIQHARGYPPLKMRHSVYPIVSFSSAAAMPLILLGLLVNTPFLINFGIVLFSSVVIFQLITLPVEFNASKRALGIISDVLYFDDTEVSDARKVLFAAALTYVASALTSVMQLLRLIILSNNRRR